jgi:hypothetical protein
MRSCGKYAARAVPGVGLAVAAATPLPLAYGNAAGCGYYGHAPAYGYAGGCGYVSRGAWLVMMRRPPGISKS